MGKGLHSTPMTMVDFFEASRGTWLNRRAVHHLDHQDDEAADSNLVIEPFDAADPVVGKICEALNVDNGESTGGSVESKQLPNTMSIDDADHCIFPVYRKCVVGINRKYAVAMA